MTLGHATCSGWMYKMVLERARSASKLSIRHDCGTGASQGEMSASPQDQTSSGIACWGSCNVNAFIQQLPRPRLQPAGMTLPPTMTCSSEAQSDLKVSTSMPIKPSGACPREPQHPRVRCAARIGTGQAVPGASGGALDASRGLRPKTR